MQNKLFINGEFVDARSGETFVTSNPATEEKITDVASAGAEDVDAAVRAARAQMEPGSGWQKMKPRDRAKVLWRIADMLSARAAEIGRIETIDNGKPIFESQYVDTPAAAECLYYFAGWSGKVTGETIPIADNAFTYTLREPVGVVGAITPWNFPLMLAVWKIAPALACGNTVVIKPASNTSLSLLKFAEYAKECGLPPGVLNVVPGRGSVVGNALVDHPGVDAIAFTGSSEVGRGLMARAARTLKKVSLELGGKSPNIVFADADLEAAARGALNAIFYGKGEVCAAGSRLLVEEGAHDELMSRITERATKMVAADPLDPKTRLGAIVSKEQMETVLSYIEAGKSDGARLVAGGTRADIGTGKGYFVKPTISMSITASPGRRSSARCWPRSVSRTRTTPSPRATPPFTAWPPPSGPAISPRPTVSPAPSRPARSGSTATTSTTRPFRSAASRSRGSDAIRGRTHWRSTRRPRASG
jgi:aldehyde dehydrogenase (NAD+)